MRILVLTSTFPRWQGDAEPGFVHELCKHLSDRGTRVDVLAPHAAGASLYERLGDISVYRYKYFFTRFEKLAYTGGINANMKKYWYGRLLVPFFLFSQCLAIRHRLKQEQYDLVHAHWIIPQALCCSLLFRLIPGLAIPLVCTSHGGDLYSFNNSLFRHVKKRVIAKVDHLCVVSTAMRNDVMSFNAREDKVSVLSMGVDLSGLFQPDVNVRRHPQKIIFVGRFVEKKGISLLIEAVSKLKKDFPGIELVLVGDGPVRRRLQEQVRQSGMIECVEFHGSVHQSGLPALFSSAAIAVVPSTIDQSGDREGLGLVAIEAMGCECAVVVSSTSAMEDIVADGDTGLVFTMDNADELGSKLRYLLQHADERQSIAKRGREFVRERYDWNVITSRYQALLEQQVKSL